MLGTLGALLIQLMGIGAKAQVNPWPWPDDPPQERVSEVVKMRIGFTTERCIYGRNSPISSCSVTLPHRGQDQSIALTPTSSCRDSKGSPERDPNTPDCTSVVKKGHWIDLTEVAAGEVEQDDRYIGIVTITKYPKLNGEGSGGAVDRPSYHILAEVLNGARVAAAETFVSDLNDLNSLSLLAAEKKDPNSSIKIKLDIASSLNPPGKSSGFDRKHGAIAWKIISGEEVP